MSNRLRFRPKYRKIVEALLYIAEKRPGTDHYAASKFIYLSDWRHFNVYGRPITFDQISAMPWGPVATKTYELLKREAPAMREAGLTELPFDTERVEKIIYLGKPKRAVDLDVFSESDIEIIDEVLKEFGSLSMPELHELTKKHVGYKSAWNNKLAGARFAPIPYEDMLDSAVSKEALIEDLAPISDRL